MLIIDADVQDLLTASLKYIEPDDMEISLATVLGKIINGEDFKPGEGIIHHREGIDLMPANMELSGLEVSLVNVMSRENILR